MATHPKHVRRRKLYALVLIGGLIVGVQLCTQFLEGAKVTRQIISMMDTVTSRGAMPSNEGAAAHNNPIKRGNDRDWCRVLITNQNVDFHYETLESAIALYPLPVSNSCKHSSLKFTIKLSNGRGNPRLQRKSESWTEYAQQRIMTRVYGEGRQLVNITFTPSLVLDDDHNDTASFDYIIDTSCYCDEDRFKNQMWLLSDQERHFCVFHTHDCAERVQQLAPNQSQWLNPMVPHSYFPKYLPTFQHARVHDPNQHHLCMLGQAHRKRYELVGYYLQQLTREGQESRLKFHNFGSGPVPKYFRKSVNNQNRTKLFEQHIIAEFVAYQENIYDTCDAILSLLTRTHQPQYFINETKLSGNLVQASAYQLPVVVHEDLANGGYRQLLSMIETHTDDADSFVSAVDRLIGRLDEVKKKQ